MKNILIPRGFAQVEGRVTHVRGGVPITPDDHGAPLPAEVVPGKAYSGYREALVKRDAQALRPFLSHANREFLANAEAKGKAAAEMDSMASEHPGKSVQITKGFSKGNHAVLLIAGESPYSKLTGEVVLVNEGGSWRVDDELTDVVLR